MNVYMAGAFSMYGIGAAGLAAGITLLVLDMKKSETPAAAPAAAIVPHPGGLSALVRF